MVGRPLCDNEVVEHDVVIDDRQITKGDMDMGRKILFMFIKKSEKFQNGPH